MYHQDLQNYLKQFLDIQVNILLNYLQETKFCLLFSLEHIDNVIHSRKIVQHETNLNLSDDENEEIDDENPSKIQHSDSDTENDDDELNRTV